MASQDSDVAVPPVYRLPAEILSSIFIDLRTGRQWGHELFQSVRFSHVSRLWRAIAISTPLLWTDIQVHSNRSFERAFIYLERSQNCSIDIYFDIWHSDRLYSPEAGVAHIQPVLDLVIQHAARWQSLSIFAAHRCTTTSILSKTKDTSVPLLRHMRVVDDGVPMLATGTVTDQAHPLHANIFNAGAPSLASVQTDNLCLCPPLSNVTILHLYTVSAEYSTFELNPHFLSEFAAACPSLTTLSIQGQFLGVWGTPVEQLSMPSIRHLLLRNSDTLAAKFLTTVSLPNLESLWLRCPFSDVIQAISAHPPLDLPALKYLTLERFELHSSPAFARVFPTVKNLHLCYFNLFHTNYLKEALLENQWPKLDTLVFRSTREAYIKKFSKIINQLIEGRISSGNPIRRVFVDQGMMDDLRCTDWVRSHAIFDVLQRDNFDDPWWKIPQTNFQRSLT